jgi:hypothetical protein
MGRWERRARRLRATDSSNRSEVAGAVLGDRIDVGDGLTAIDATDEVQKYDPAADRWMARAPLPQAIHHPAAAALGGRLYVIGRSRAARPPGPPSRVPRPCSCCSSGEAASYR